MSALSFHSRYSARNVVLPSLSSDAAAFAEAVAGFRPGEAPRSPAPGLGRLPELISLPRVAGLSVTSEVAGQPWPLPTTVDLAAYRDRTQLVVLACETGLVRPGWLA